MIKSHVLYQLSYEPDQGAKVNKINLIFLLLFDIIKRKSNIMEKNSVEPGFLSRLTFEPLTSGNWEKFVELFGVNGACGNCFCMYYRLSNKDFRKGTVNEENKRSMHEIVKSGKPAGLLGILENRAIAWCAFAPREDFMKLAKSRVHKRIDDENVWSIPCFFIDRKFRKSGVSSEILKGAIRYAENNGIKIIEAYPLVPRKEKVPDTFAWFGLLKTFERAGFEVADRKSVSRPMVRYYIDKVPND